MAIISEPKVKNLKILEFSTITDPRGSLSFTEVGKEVPFDIKRAFWIYGTPGNTSRGSHAHKESSQVHICLSGHAMIEFDDGRTREIRGLDSPKQGFLIGPMVWHRFSLVEGSALLVLTSNLYDPDDYIRDYEEFQRLAK